MAKSDRFLSVVFPAYNEEYNIERTMKRSLQALRDRFSAFEIILIDDQSRDHTFEKAKTIAADNPEIHVLRNTVNMGQGKTLLRAFDEARGEFVIHNAVDYPFDLEDLDVMIPLMDDADIIVAARRARPGYSAYRRAVSSINIFLIRALFGLKIRDYNFVQMYRRDVLNKISITADSTGFLTPEIIIRANDMGYRVVEVEVDYHPREFGIATAGSPKVLIKSFRDMISFFIRRAFKRL